MNTKAIYMPKGKAGEYAKYACNFFVGCSHNCDYCYCKKGILSHALGKPYPELKKCFKNMEHAFITFAKELQNFLFIDPEDLKHRGLFFCFTSDPMLEECILLNRCAIELAIRNEVPCKILTKRADFLNELPENWFTDNNIKKHVAFGFTLTGHDELEPGASTNAERIQTMRILHDMGCRTFASIEPIIDLETSANMIEQSHEFCDLFLIGLLSGQKSYSRNEVLQFIEDTRTAFNFYYDYGQLKHVYLKNSVLDFVGLKREDLIDQYPFVNSDFDLFNK